MVSLIIRKKRSNLGTLSCQGEIAKINFSLGENFGEDVPPGGPVWVAVHVSVGLLLVVPDLRLHSVVIANQFMLILS